MGNPGPILSNNPYNSPKYYFPLDLGSQKQTPYCLLDIREAVAEGGGKSKGSIAMYMPTEVVSQYHAQYEESSHGILGWDPSFIKAQEAGADVVAAIVKGEVPGISDTIRGVKKTLIGSWNGGGAIGASKATALNTSDRLQRDLGMIVNPHMAALFKGVGFRQFQLSWQMMARNQKESEMIRNIVFTLKYHMLPSVPEGEAQSRYMLYPEHFVILFATPKINQMFLVHECGLEDLIVTYNGSAVPAFFKDTNAPVDVRITCQFKELTTMTKELISKGF